MCENYGYDDKVQSWYKYEFHLALLTTLLYVQNFMKNVATLISTTVPCCLTLPVNFPFQTVCVNNVEFYNHLKFHLNRSVDGDNKFPCNYCLGFFPEAVARDHHTKTVSVTFIC